MPGLPEQPHLYGVQLAVHLAARKAPSRPMTIENVDRVLDSVRPILIADGGNVEVVEVGDGVVALRLQVNIFSREGRVNHFIADCTGITAEASVGSEKYQPAYLDTGDMSI